MGQLGSSFQRLMHLIWTKIILGLGSIKHIHQSVEKAVPGKVSNQRINLARQGYNLLGTTAKHSCSSCKKAEQNKNVIIPLTHHLTFFHSSQKGNCAISHSNSAPELSRLPWGTVEQTKLLAAEHPLESEATTTKFILKQKGQNQQELQLHNSLVCVYSSVISHS